MPTERLNDRARLLRSYHDDGILVLPNAWDAMSAALIAEAGARAVATTSGGIAWALGFTDGEQLTRDDMVAAVARIAAVVDVPVTADVEGGYGPDPADVSTTVGAIIGAGAAGINLEDSRTASGPLHSADEQAKRIAAARDAAGSHGVGDLVVNARTDVFLLQVGAAGDRLDDVVARARSYADAGADCLFVPGLVDLAAIRELVAAAPIAVNVMAVPGGPTVAEFGAAGVRRVSVGTGVTQAAYGIAGKAARELIESGTYDTFAGAADFGHLNAVFSR